MAEPGQLTKEERREMAAKQQQEARSWLIEVGGDVAKALETDGKLVKQLKGGVILCTALNSLKPGSVDVDEDGSLDNVKQFLSACKDIYDVPEAYLFDAEAFEAGRGSGRVVATILAVRDKSKTMAMLEDSSSSESSSDDNLVLYTGLKTEDKSTEVDRKMSLEVEMIADTGAKDSSSSSSSSSDDSDSSSDEPKQKEESSEEESSEDSSESKESMEAPASSEESSQQKQASPKATGKKANGSNHVVLSKTSTSGELQLWLYQNNFQDYAETFSQYTGAAFMRLVGDRERLERIVSPQHSFLMEILLEENNASDFIEMKKIQQNSFRLSTLGVKKDVSSGKKKVNGKVLISVGSSSEDSDSDDTEQFEKPEKKVSTKKLQKSEPKAMKKTSAKQLKKSSSSSDKKSDKTKEPKVALDEKPKKKKRHLASHERDYFTGKPLTPDTPGVIITGRYACLKQNFKCLNCKSKSFDDPKIAHHSMPDGDGLYCAECIDKLWPTRPPKPAPEFEYQQEGSYKAIRKREKIEYKIEKLQAKHEELMKPKEKKAKKGILGMKKKSKDKH
mmetsp:Transcript_20716/g.23023  ORF Transcript_20716/g.23023 Transcript_20716/m.23023 type:complete len:561 (+) Transcript_20716:23-1705(+)